MIGQHIKSQKKAYKILKKEGPLKYEELKSKLEVSEEKCKQ